MDKCCANCKWIDTDPYDHGLVCVNADSPYCAELWARPDDCCEEWEGKKEHTCSTCKHDYREWDSFVCDTCTFGDNNNWERKDDD